LACKGSAEAFSEAALNTGAAEHVVQQAPAVINRQKLTPDKQGNPRDLKKLLKDPCFGDDVDDAKARCQFSSHQCRTSLVLCPPFFMDEIYKVHVTPRYLIHEAGHLAGVNKPSRDELYCHQGEVTKDDKCPVVDAFHNADAWAHFIEELSYTI
jgi:hypothetical protein